MFVKTLGPRILRRTGFRALMVWNALLASAFLAVNGFYTAQTSHWIMVILLFVGGCSRSIQFTCVNAIAYADLESREMSAATTMRAITGARLSLSRMIAAAVSPASTGRGASIRYAKSGTSASPGVSDIPAKKWIPVSRSG